MIVFLNGELIPEEKAAVSIFDRGLLYGDGLFETVRIFNGKPFRWDLHQQRLLRGTEYLKMRLPYRSSELSTFANALIEENRLPNALLRVLVTRGTGPRGYSPRGANHSTVAMSLHPASARPAEPAQWKLVISKMRLPADEPLAQFKTCNKLAQIIARGEADSVEANEALLLNTNGFVVEGSSSNLFWLENEAVCTPPLAAGILPGVTRAVMSEICRATGQAWQETEASAERLLTSQGLFLSLTSIGLAEAMTLDGKPLARSPVVRELHSAYWELLERECA